MRKSRRNSRSRCAGPFDEDRACWTAVHKGMAEKQTPNLDLKIDVGPDAVPPQSRQADRGRAGAESGGGMTPEADQSAAAKGGFRALKVVAKVPESSLITSFHLQAADGSALPPFRPGQFLVFRIPSGDGTVLRNYSLSGSPDDLRSYRISVKREPSAGPGLPVGLSSTYLHDQIEVGDVLMVDGPRGAFVLDETSTRPVVLLSGGVGLTPMVAMLHRLAKHAARRVLFLHACENGAVHALRMR